MTQFFRPRRLLVRALVAVMVAAFAVTSVPSIAHASAKKEKSEGGEKEAKPKKEAKKTEEKKGEEGGPVGYGGAIVQMSPIMVPYRASNGVRYEVVTVRLTLDAGPKERSACFSIPYVHDKFVLYLFGANLTVDDFSGERKEVLAKNLFDVAVNTVGKGFYSAAEIIGADPPELDPKSQTLSAQCK